MKRLIILIASFAIVVMTEAQSVTRSLVYMKEGQTIYNYTGTAADTINGDAVDTLRFPIFHQVQQPFRVWCEVALKARTGTDTTYYINIYGRNTENQAWTKTEAVTLSNAVTTAGIYTVANNVSEAYYLLGDSAVNSTTPNACLKYTYTPTNSNLYYRYLMVEVRALGNDATGTGVKVTGFKLILYRK